jgi:hypothetical protein
MEASMSDVVERLRDWPAGGQDMLSSTVVGGMMEEAADEIERLRACNATLRDAITPLAELYGGDVNMNDPLRKWLTIAHFADARYALKGNQ